MKVQNEKMKQEPVRQEQGGEMKMLHLYVYFQVFS